MLLLRLKSRSASRSKKNRTWLAFLSGRFNQWLPEPKVEREKELGHVEVREREEPEVREFEPPKAKNKPERHQRGRFLAVWCYASESTPDAQGHDPKNARADGS